MNFKFWNVEDLLSSVKFHFYNKNTENENESSYDTKLVFENF